MSNKISRTPARVPRGAPAAPKLQPARNLPSARKNHAASQASLGVLPQLLGYQLRLAQRAVFADFAESVAGGEVSPGLFGILVIIEANPGLKQSELAQAALLDRSSIVPVVDKLEGQRLVERRAFPEDRRVNGLWLTESGAALLKSLKRQVARHEQRMAQRLSASERDQLVHLLRKISLAE